jgi:FkbM family methyltransferase
MFILHATTKSLLERLRCVKHNVLDHVTFRTSYRNGSYTVHTANGVELRFPHNPYLAFFQIEGYLAQGRWTIEPGMYVVDAGACWGEFGLYAAACVGPTGRVFMLEPDPANLSLLDEVLALNGGKPSNVVILNEGLAGEPGMLQFASGLGASSMLPDMGGGRTEYPAQSEKFARANSIAVQVQSLTSLVEAQHMERLDFVKMDIEGAEVEAIQGAAAIMARLKPRFAIASYHKRDGKMTSEILEPLFAKAGYYARTGFPPHQTTYASSTPLPMS